MRNHVLGGIVAIIIGGLLAFLTIFGLITSQMAKPDHSPADANQPFVNYGSTG